MSNEKKNASEKAYQENFVKELTKYRWEAPDNLNGNIHKVTVNTLIDNWRCELNRINADELEGVELTDNEFNSVLTKVNSLSNSFEASKLLAAENSKGKIDGIYRDDNPLVTKKQITLTIFSKPSVGGGISRYQVAREVSTERNNRFDIVLLINGLPLINIELKRSDKTINEAFGQFKRYYRDGEYSNNFIAFSQMMVISSEIETKYFATPKNLNSFNYNFAFHWTDNNNNVLNNWQQVIKEFLMIPMAHQMVGDYLVIDDSPEEENKKHILMRPYQVYALQAVESAAFGTDNDKKIPHGGFVWHTTGSGKTITSFKTALFLSTRVNFDKVIFLVDRQELDKNTANCYKAYTTHEVVSVDTTSNTSALRKILFSKKSSIIISTTYKLSNLINELIEQKNETLKNKKFVFIIDEAHRTNNGQMMAKIREYFDEGNQNKFDKKTLFFGFTGTPLFEDSHANGIIKDDVKLNTTAKIFGGKENPDNDKNLKNVVIKPLHQYTIDQAIADHNVLGFNIDYINTGEFKNYEVLKEKLMEKKAKDCPELSDREIQRMYSSKTDLQIEEEADKAGILKYTDETHIPVVVKDIIKYWNDNSQNKKFNAILTVAYKERVIAYYNEFKKQLQNSSIKINVAMTFSFGNINNQMNKNYKSDEYSTTNSNGISQDEVVKVMFKDYASFTGIEFIPNDDKHGEDAYFEDLLARTKRGGSGRNPKNIDLIIVADQLLTGYDSKYINTLYVDRKQELQGLIQAYSRTNRVLDSSKEFGKIVNYRYPKISEDRVNKALKLYGSGGKDSCVKVAKYEDAVASFAELVKNTIKTLQDPSKWEELNRIKDNNDEPSPKDIFIKAFTQANSQFRKLKQYYGYNWDSEKFGIEMGDWNKYIGAYINLRNSDPFKNDEEPEVPVLIENNTSIVNSIKVDQHYILMLIGEKAKVVSGVVTLDSESIRLINEKIQELSNLGEHNKSKLLKEFLDTEVLKGKVTSNEKFDKLYNDWYQNKKSQKVLKFSKKCGINFEWLKSVVKAYSPFTPDVVPYINELSDNISFEEAEDKSAKNMFEHNMRVTNDILPNFLKALNSEFNS